MTTKLFCSEPRDPSRQMIVLEGMPGAGKTSTVRKLAADGHPTLGEYTYADPKVATLPIQQHPAVLDDDAHQGNWLRKAGQARAALQRGAPVFVDRDWLSSLAYAYSLRDGKALLGHRARWALRHLHAGALLLGEVYVLFHVDAATSLQRRAGTLRPDHPWSTLESLQQLTGFYQRPIETIRGVEPALADLLSKANWRHVSGLDHPAHTLAFVRSLTRIHHQEDA